MVKTTIDYQNMTEKELCILADKNMHTAAEVKKLCDAMNPIVYEKVDEWLMKRPQDYLEAIFRLVESPEMERLSSVDYTLYNLKRLCRASKMEQQQHLEPVISKFHSLKEMQQIHQRTVFYMRRLEFELSPELCEDFYALVEEWDFSPYYLLEILLEKKLIYARYTLAEKVVEGLTEHGRKKDADILLFAICKLAEFEETDEDE